MITLNEIFKDMNKLFRKINDFFDYDIFGYTRLEVDIVNGHVTVRGKLKSLVINGYEIRVPDYVRTTQKGEIKK